MSEALLLLVLTLDATLRVVVLLIFVAMAGLFSERFGIVDIGLEGKMLVGAFVAVVIAAVIGFAWLGLLVAVAVAVALALLHGLVCIIYRGN